MACVLSTTSLEMIPMLAPQRKALRLVHRVICQELAGVRQRQPEAKSSSQGGTGNTCSGVVGTAQLSQSNVPDTSANSHGPSERMDLVTALFLDVRRRLIKLVVKALSVSSGSSFRATYTSNGDGSRASDS